MLKIHPNFKSVNNPENKNAENIYECLSKIFENDVQKNFIIKKTKDEFIKYWKDDKDNIQYDVQENFIIPTQEDELIKCWKDDKDNIQYLRIINWDKEQSPVYISLGYGQMSGGIIFRVHHTKFFLDRIDRLKFIICKKLGNDYDSDDYKCIADTMTEIEHEIKYLYPPENDDDDDDDDSNDDDNDSKDNNI